MSERITRETFDHLVKLAELELDPTEAEYLRGELNHQLDAIEQLSAIPLEEDVPLSMHGVSYPVQVSQPPRADVWQPFDNIAGILSQVPELVDEHITVPEIPHKTLE
jgi:aspartyl/glutamyl-tRNA(Asn/Gln) amidotransferase C subunit